MPRHRRAGRARERDADQLRANAEAIERRLAAHPPAPRTDVHPLLAPFADAWHDAETSDPARVDRARGARAARADPRPPQPSP